MLGRIHPVFSQGLLLALLANLIIAPITGGHSIHPLGDVGDSGSTAEVIEPLGDETPISLAELIAELEDVGLQLEDAEYSSEPSARTQEDSQLTSTSPKPAVSELPFGGFIENRGQIATG